MTTLTPDELTQLRDRMGGTHNGASKHVYPGLPDGAVVYTGLTSRGTLFACAFSGKRSRPDFNFIFHNEQRRDAYIKNWEDAQRFKGAHIQEKSAARREFATSLQVGDILNGSWGYDQTNQEWYQVTAVYGARAVGIRPLGAICSAAGYSTREFPRPDDFTGPEERKVVQLGDRITYRSYNLHKWDGDEKYSSSDH